jgi:hypothetical protein
MATPRKQEPAKTSARKQEKAKAPARKKTASSTKRTAAAPAARAADAPVALTLKVDRECYEQLSQLRRQQHRTVQEILSEALANYLETEASAPEELQGRTLEPVEYQEDEPPQVEIYEDIPPQPRRGGDAGTPPVALWKLLTFLAFVLFCGYSVHTVQQFSGYTIPWWKATGLVVAALAGVGVLFVLYRAKANQR